MIQIFCYERYIYWERNYKNSEKNYSWRNLKFNNNEANDVIFIA